MRARVSQLASLLPLPYADSHPAHVIALRVGPHGWLSAHLRVVLFIKKNIFGLEITVVNAILVAVAECLKPGDHGISGRGESTRRCTARAGARLGNLPELAEVGWH